MKRSVLRCLFALPVTALAGGNIQACDPSGDQVIGLQVTPGEFAEPGRTLDVKLFENACVQVQRPVHFRRPGRHRLQLSADEGGAFEALRSEPALRDFDAGTVLAHVAALQRGRGAGGGHELFEVFDADRYVLTLQDRTGIRELRFDAVFQYAERYPEVAELRAMAELVARLQQLADDERLTRADGSDGTGEVLP